MLKALYRMKGYIYKYENIQNGKIYIGQTDNLKRRKSEHKTNSKKQDFKFYRAIRKYGWENFNYNVIAQVEADTKEQLTLLLDDLEIKYIAYYDSYNNGYNSTLGGHTTRGFKMSEEYKEYCRHRTYSEETRKKMSESAKRKNVSDEFREKQRQLAIARNFGACSNVDKKKREQAIIKARSKPVLVYDTQGNLLIECSSIRNTVKYIQPFILKNITYDGLENAVIRHLKGKTKKDNYYGFVFKYKTKV